MKFSRRRNKGIAERGLKAEGVLMWNGLHSLQSSPGELPLPKLAGKHPAKPNEYIQSGGVQGEDAMGSDQNPEKIEVTMTTPDLNPEPDRNPVSVEEVTNPLTTRNSLSFGNDMSQQKLADGTFKHSVEQAHTVFLDSEKAQKSYNPEGPLDKSRVSAHVYEKLAPGKRQQLHDSVSSHSGSECDRLKISKKKLAPRKSRPVYQNNHHSRPIESSTTERQHVLSPQSGTADGGPCDAFPHLVANRFEATLPSAAEVHCEDCFNTSEPENEFDWGWLIDSSQTSQFTENLLPNQCRCSRHSNPVVSTRYVNDNHLVSAHDASLDRGLEVNFTVTADGGRSFQFAIMHSGTHVRLQHDVLSDVFCSGAIQKMTPSMLQRCQGTERENERFDDHLASTSSSLGRHDRRERGSCPTMTPNLKSPGTATTQTLSGTQKSGKERFFKVQKTANLSCDPPTLQKSHFELSMASYSKLRAYCDSRHDGQPGRQAQQQKRDELGEKRRATSGTSASTSIGHVDDLCRLAKVFETVEECPWYWGEMTGRDAKNVLLDTKPGTFLLRDSSDPRHLFSLSVKTLQGPTSIRIVYIDGAFRFDSEMDDLSAHRRARQQPGRNGSTGDPARPNHPNYVKRVTPVFTCVIKMVLHHTKLLGYSYPASKAQRSGGDKPAETQCPKCLAKRGKVPSDIQQGSTGLTKTERSHPEQFMCYWINQGARQEISVLLSTPLSKTRSFPTLQRLCRQRLNVSQKLWDREDIVDRFPLPNSLKKYIKKYPYPV